MNQLRENPTLGIVLAIVVILVALVAFALVVIQATLPAPVAEAEAVVAPCQIELAGQRLVYDEPANPESRVGVLEQGSYRVVAFAPAKWVSVDWAGSGIEPTQENLLRLDWIQLEDGLDAVVGGCGQVPQLGLRSSRD